MKYTFDRCASHILVHVQDESSSLSHLPIALWSPALLPLVSKGGSLLEFLKNNLSSWVIEGAFDPRS